MIFSLELLHSTMQMPILIPVVALLHRLSHHPLIHRLPCRPLLHHLSRQLLQLQAEIPVITTPDTSPIRLHTHLYMHLLLPTDPRPTLPLPILLLLTVEGADSPLVRLASEIFTRAGLAQSRGNSDFHRLFCSSMF